MRVKTKLLPNSSFGWFCFGIFVSATALKIGSNSPGIYAFLFFILFLILTFVFLSPPKFTKPFERKAFFAILASFVFLVFADTNQTSIPKQAKPFFRSFLMEELKQSPLSLFERRIVLGLVTGSTKEIPKDFKELAKESGILHLFAASGLHLGIFIGALQWFGNFIFTKHRWISILISLGFGFFYLYVLNFPVSFVRAYLFAFLTLVSSLFYRKIAVSDLLFISSAGISFFLFSDFLSIGFLLSFSAVFGIFYLKPSLDRMVFPRFQSLWKDNLTLTTACSLCSFPILIYYFHSFSYGGIWINYCLVPMAGILLPSLYFTILIQTLLPTVLSGLFIDWLWTPSSFLLSLFLKLLHTITFWERGYKVWKEANICYLFVSLFLIFLLWFLHRMDWNQKKYTNMFVVGMICLFFPSTYWIQDSSSHQNLFQQGKGYFSFVISDGFYLFGTCSPYKRMEFPNPITAIKRIEFESESCLQTVLRLKKKHKGVEVIWFDRNQSPFGTVLDKDGLQIQRTKHLGGEITPFLSLFRFDGNPKQITSLLGSLKETERAHSQSLWQGYLVLDFPPWKKKEAKEWINYQKLLGISNAWKILIVEDHFEIPLLHHLTNPKLL
ncbi:ComEC/Rec2 family competence protein [Leptospira biflexa]|uniref:ComEC/Rec2 family competence protein n=1 Tax=Leptospira biflexa TaxID=172 RepID=UPI001082A341|nr:ComEC/Rec2 family competence protein [Leptospira biflexa]TGM35085.1 ComEC/Rec2 family competence protein [Leptospira biflexa]TGM38480.1 ComEC/Rec2 family competence protein [Leptospira biflexa]